MFARPSAKTEPPRSARSQMTGRAQVRSGTPSSEQVSGGVHNADAASLQGRWGQLVHRDPELTPKSEINSSSEQVPHASAPAALRPCPLYIQAQLKVGHPDDPVEHEAETVAEQVMHGPAPSISSVAGSRGISRKCAGCEEEEGNRSDSVVVPQIPAT